MKNNSYRRFIFVFFSVISLPILLTGLFNWIINPFDYFQSPSIDKINAVKVSIKKQQRLHRAVEIIRQKPEALFLGSSRVMAGLDPMDFIQLSSLTTYNAGFAGASIEEVYHYFEHALYHQPHLKVVILGLDFFAFRKKKPLAKDFSISKLKQGTFEWKNRLPLLFSLNALKGSFETIIDNRSGQNFPCFLPYGLFNPIICGSSQNEFLAKGDAAYIKMIFENADFYNHYELGEDKICFFEKIVKRCQEKNILLKVFFCPCKVIYWEGLYRKDLWPTLETLKRQLSALHPIWDFSGFNCVTTQSLEPDSAPLYYECSHFRPSVGKMILQKLFAVPSAPVNFGCLLTENTVEKALKQIREDREEWLKTQPVEINQIQQAFN